ncbi:MAG: alternative ribosome rescue factor ArfA [Zavarzinia sp.]|nr:alternative ribosome rescue factor ArfA [Zavarzinia sp.]
MREMKNLAAPKTAKAMVMQVTYRPRVVRARKGKGAYTRKGRGHAEY